MSHPVPRIARLMLRLVADAEHRDAMLHDLDEEAAALARTSGLAAARRWSRQQVMASVGPLFVRRMEIALTSLRRTPMSAMARLGIRSDGGGPAAPRSARLHTRVRADARARHRRQHGSVHADRPRAAEVAAGAAAVGTVSAWRHRRLLRELRRAGFVFAVLVRPLYAAARCRAAVQPVGGLPGQHESRHDRPRERGHAARDAERRVRVGQLLPALRAGACGRAPHPAVGRPARRRAGCRHQLPRVDAALPGARGYRRQRRHPERRIRDSRRCGATGILRRSAAAQPAGDLDPALERAAAAARGAAARGEALALAVHHRASEARRCRSRRSRHS